MITVYIIGIVAIILIMMASTYSGLVSPSAVSE